MGQGIKGFGKYSMVKDNILKIDELVFDLNTLALTLTQKLVLQKLSCVRNHGQKKK